MAAKLHLFHVQYNNEHQEKLVPIGSKWFKRSRHIDSNP